MNKLIFTVELDGSDLYKVNNNNADAFERKADRLLMTPAFYSIVRDALKKSLEAFNSSDDTIPSDDVNKPCTCKSRGNNKGCKNNCTKKVAKQ